MKKFGYSNSEKLKLKKDISLLFEKGKWLTFENLRIISLPEVDDSEKVKNGSFGVSVSKRYFKKAVDRNRVKRLLRECYRLNKGLYKERFGENSTAMIFWVSPQKPKSYQEVENNFLNLCRSKK